MKRNEMADRLHARLSDLRTVFGPQTESGKGRLINLISSLLTGVYTIFVTGIFYTGFLSLYGISITETGIITFVPYLANCFCIFSTPVLNRFHRRKPVLLLSKIVYYFLIIIAVNLMPLLVSDTAGRVRWFTLLLFAANAENALFSPGFTSWFYHFFPEDNDLRVCYYTYSQLFTSVLANLVLVISGWLADAVRAQAELIIGFRYAAFLLVILDVCVQAQAKEYEEPGDQGSRIRDVFTVPFRHRKFIRCTALMGFWTYNCNLTGLWLYHVLNHMHFSYLVINLVSSSYMIVFLIISPLWRRLIRKYSWIRTFGLANLIWVPTEFVFFFMSEGTRMMYPLLTVLQHFLSTGLNLAYANVLYMNLPQNQETSCISFQVFACNFAAFLGAMVGTALSAISGDSTVAVLGIPIYSIQFNCLLRGVNMLAMGLYCWRHWQELTSESEIRRVENRQ